MARAYEHLAAWFEMLNDDCGYPDWADYLIGRLKAFGAGRSGLELGCGSGYFCRALQRAGFCMSGADHSLPMLSCAEQRAREENLPIGFFYADAAALKTPERYDFVLSPNDCFNYIPPQKLERAFCGVKRALKKGGLFFFDISTKHKLLGELADTVSADDREEITYLAFHTREKDAVKTEVTLFVKRRDGAFDRMDETHRRYLHEEGDVSAALEAAGFTVLRVEGHLGEEKEGSGRLNFLCKLEARSTKL